MFFRSAVAKAFIVVAAVIVVCQYLLVMLADNRSHVLHATVADFNVVLVEIIVVFVMSGEMLCYKFQECSADVTAVRGVVLDDVSLAVFSRASCLSVLAVG